MKYILNIKIIKINNKKYKTVPSNVFIKSKFFNIKFFSFLKDFFSIVTNPSSEFFFKNKHSSNLFNIDLINGYLGLRCSRLFSIEIIIFLGIFDI